MLVNPIVSKLEELGLQGMARGFALQFEQPDMQRLHFEERLGLMWRPVCGTYAASLEDVDFRPDRKFDKAMIMSLREWG